MNRIIKFRAWDGEQMVSPEKIDRNGIAWWSENSIPTSSSIIMQFTGLKDVAGDDVYECDLVKRNGDGGIWKIVYFDHYACFCFQKDNDIYPINNTLDFKIVGNMFSTLLSVNTK